jgi:hypothetical protein
VFGSAEDERVKAERAQMRGERRGTLLLHEPKLPLVQLAQLLTISVDLPK